MHSRFYLRLLSSLYISTFFIRASFGIMLATLPIYLKITNTYIGYGIVAAASPLFEMGTVLFIGAVVDRFGRKIVLLAGLLGAAVLLFLLTLTHNMVLIFFINAGHGLAAGAILVASLALLTDYAPEYHRGREMGAFDAFNLLGWVAGYAMGALFLEILKASLWESFMIAGLMALIGSIYSWVNITEPKKYDILSNKVRFDSIIAVLRQRSILLLTLPWFIVFMIIGSVLTFLTVSTSQGILTISPILLSGIIAGVGIVLVVTQVFYGWLSDRFGRLPVLVVGAIGFIGVISMIGVGYGLASPATAENVKDSIVRFWPLLGVFGFMALAFGPSALSSLADETREKRRGVTMAVYSIVISAGMFVGVPLVAAIFDRFGGLGVLYFMVACAVSMFLLVVARFVEVQSRKKMIVE
ncbi:MAG TPA: MFS transporter [Candidatus Thermoplasmatota archaeon]|nr:MFS transporter [Candidatus Thermoplasmatota archaeon]